MATTVWVVHRTTGRVRLRLPGHKGDALFFATLAESARSVPGVLGARPNPLAASLVIEHEIAERQELDHALQTLGFELVEGEPPAEPPLQALVGGFAEVERELRGITGNAADLRTVGFLVLATAGLVQVARGNPLSAASSLLYHAFELLRGAPRPAGLLDADVRPADPSASKMP
jgi:hypothetical protein